MYLFNKRKNYFISLIPAIFMTYMIFVYILNAQIGFNLDLNVSFIVGIFLTAILTVLFFMKAKKNRLEDVETDVDVAA